MNMEMTKQYSMNYENNYYSTYFDKFVTPFGFFGGKFYHLAFILSHLPMRSAYLEPFLGAGSVFINRSRSKSENVNDKSRRIVAIHKCLQKPELLDQLVEALRVTPYAKDEYDDAWDDDDADCTVERARKALVRLKQSMGSLGLVRQSATWSTKYTSYGKIRPTPVGWNKNTLEHNLRKIAERYDRAQIHNGDALKFIKRYMHEDAVLYADPPYHGHENDYPDSVDHDELADVLHEFPGFVAISGEPGPEMERLYGDWIRVDSGGISFMSATKEGVKKKKRVESLWLNQNLETASQLI